MGSIILKTTRLRSITQTFSTSEQIIYFGLESVRLLIPFCVHRYKVEAEEGLDNIVVVDGVPIVDRLKLDRLLAKISKEFGKRGAHIKPDSIFVPWDDAAGKSKGCVVFEPIPGCYF